MGPSRPGSDFYFLFHALIFYSGKAPRTRFRVVAPEAKKQAMAYLAPVQTHLLEEGCIGSISEIFDGDAPHTCRGCYAQAWSVGEILRCYTQDIQKNQK